MISRRTVTIDCFPEAAHRFRGGFAVVAVDVIRATTTAVTAASTGRACLPVPSVEAAYVLAKVLRHPLLVGEVGGNMPYGFDYTNSPAEIARLPDPSRPMILVSSSGTQLVHNASGCDAVYLGCFRNMRATVAALAARHDRIAVIGAGTRGEFREEDQMCCAQVAIGLMDLGYEADDQRTTDVAERWRDAPHDAWMESNSVRYLTNTGQLEDLEFVRSHVEDLDEAYRVQGGVVVPATYTAGSRVHADDAPPLAISREP
jgi:2-phosphosulfolactate phosphatase